MGILFANPFSAVSVPSTNEEQILPSVVQASQSPYSLQEYAVLIAREEHIDPRQFKKLIQCESGWDDAVHGDNGKAFSLLQFHEDTFITFEKKYNLDLEYHNPAHQIELAARMIRDGGWKHWYNCGKKIGY